LKGQEIGLEKTELRLPKLQVPSRHEDDPRYQGILTEYPR